MQKIARTLQLSFKLKKTPHTDVRVTVTNYYNLDKIKKFKSIVRKIEAEFGSLFVMKMSVWALIL